jgi:hypothetical protein
LSASIRETESLCLFPSPVREIKVNNASLFKFFLDVNIHFPSSAYSTRRDPVMFLFRFICSYSLMVPLEFILSLWFSVCLRFSWKAFMKIEIKIWKIFFLSKPSRMKLRENVQRLKEQRALYYDVVCLLMFDVLDRKTKSVIFETTNGVCVCVCLYA